MVSSIKVRIVLFYLAILLVTLSVMGNILYFSLHRIVYAFIDSSLLSRAKALATLISEDIEDVSDDATFIREDELETEFNFSDEIMWEYSSPTSTNYFQIRRVDGTTIEKSASLGDSELPFYPVVHSADFQTTFLKGRKVRLVNFPMPKEGVNEIKTPRYDIVIQCAEAIEEKTSILSRFRMVLAVTVFFVVIFSAAGGFFIAKKALEPIRNISDAIDRVSETNLSERIADKKIADELKRIADSFNRVFSSLEMAFNRQRQFVSDASHELKTPLSVIISQTEVSLRKEREPGEYRAALTAILNTAGMMSLLIEKLMTLARFSSDRLILQMEEISLNGIIDKTLKLLSPLADEKRILITMPADGSKYSVYGDSEALPEAFVNIVDNAIKYNVPDGRIDISIRKEGEFIIAEIADTGIGIQEGELEKVFDRFYRVDKSRSRASGGIGLGLSISREIIRQHGGRIEIKSQIDKGTVVSVYLKGAKYE